MSDMGVPFSALYRRLLFRPKSRLRRSRVLHAVEADPGVTPLGEYSAARRWKILVSEAAAGHDDHTRRRAPPPHGATTRRAKVLFNVSAAISGAAPDRRGSTNLDLVFVVDGRPAEGAARTFLAVQARTGAAAPRIALAKDGQSAAGAAGLSDHGSASLYSARPRWRGRGRWVRRSG